MNLTKRSYQPELLDHDFIPFNDIRQNMKELEIINRWLGGHKITVDAFRELAGKKKEISVCEIGSGGGDNLIAISKLCRKRSVKLKITGIDSKQECIDFAKTRHHFSNSANWIMSDYCKVRFGEKPDIIFSSLFCHHFTDEQLEMQLQWMRNNSKIGFFVNDLQRNVMAYYSIKTLTKFFSNSYLVKNDAPLSVARGFTRNELINICKKANLEGARVSWKWAFRFLIVWKHE